VDLSHLRAAIVHFEYSHFEQSRLQLLCGTSVRHGYLLAMNDADITAFRPV
jgi:hypothetical protein